MTSEEKIALMKAMGVDMGKTEIVFEKNVEYEIGNVEAGGIGVQINNGGTAATRNNAKKNPTSTAPRVTDSVFSYTYKDDPEGHMRLVKFYQYLSNPKATIHFIDPATKPADLCDLFLGKAAAKKVKWIRPQAELHYLIDKLIKRKLITCPKDATKWIVTGSHFVDSESRPFDKPWNKVGEPSKIAPALDRLVDVLDITKPFDE